jgi:hypothetical protein
MDEWSAQREDLYLTTHNTHKRQTSWTPAGLEPTIPAGERPQTHALDRAVIGFGSESVNTNKFQIEYNIFTIVVLYILSKWSCKYIHVMLNILK